MICGVRCVQNSAKHSMWVIVCVALPAPIQLSSSTTTPATQRSLLHYTVQFSSRSAFRLAAVLTSPNLNSCPASVPTESTHTGEMDHRAIASQVRGESYVCVICLVDRNCNNLVCTRMWGIQGVWVTYYFRYLSSHVFV